MEWQPIETAPKDGTVFEGCSLDPHRLWSPRLMRWGVAKRPDEGYVCNSGKPWWINEDCRHLAPRPTHWRPAPHVSEPAGIEHDGADVSPGAT